MSSHSQPCLLTFIHLSPAFRRDAAARHTLHIYTHIPPMLRRGRRLTRDSVILGSLSNYLVTKSSVPVMVARKRLRKKARRGPERQVNNLSNPAGRSLARARID